MVEGEAIVRIDEREHRTGPGSLVTIPKGVRHHVRNPGATPLFLLTVYAPPEYEPGTTAADSNLSPVS